MQNRVVVTGIGVVAPNGTGIVKFTEALKSMRSGIKHWDELEANGINCRLGGVPELDEAYIDANFSSLWKKILVNNGVIYGCLAGIEAWQDAGLPIDADKYDPDTGMVVGAGAVSMDEAIPPYLHHIENGLAKKAGSTGVSQSMNSSAGAYLSGLFGCGNRIMSNSSACCTGTEAVILGYEHIKRGQAKRMLCGSSEGQGKYIWGAFDAMRVLCRDSNERPEYGSRPMSATSSGFVPGAGAGMLVLEDLATAQARGAKIYAEIKGGAVNSGGQRNGGSMTAPNSLAVQNCIRSAFQDSGLTPADVDLVSGHLTSTMADPIEIANWVAALGLDAADFPLINATKGMIGHCISAAGSIELVACIAQMREGFIHGNLNVESEIHPEILKVLPAEKIPVATISKDVDVVVKANFGFGDVNTCIILQNWK